MFTLRRRICASMLIVSMLVLGVVGISAQDMAVPEGTVKIGLVGPFTGPAAGIGQELLNFANLAISDFNEANGWDVQAVEVDTQIDPTVAVTAVESILSDPEVYGAMGPAGSQVVAAVMGQFQDAGMVHVSPVSTDPSLTDPDNPDKTDTFFRVVPTDAIQGPSDADYLYNELGVTQLFIVDDQTTYGVGLAEQTATAFEDLGGTVVGQEFVSQDDTDFSALVTRIGDSGAEALFFPGQLASQGALMATQLLEQGVDIIFFGADGFNNKPEFIDDAAGTTEGAYVSVFAPDVRLIPTSADIVARYVEQYDDEFSSFGPPAYVATQVVLEAMLRDFEANGELTRAGVLAEVAKTNIEMSLLGNPIVFDENGDVENATFYVFKVENGEFVFQPPMGDDSSM